MNDIENDLLFSSLIKINYDTRFIKIAQGFIENLSSLAGANKKESFQISLLIEECLAFIINKYIDYRVAAYIEICFKATAGRKIQVDITDIGPPIHESMIPSFDITNEDSEAGLWYKVVRGLSDKFIFINQLGAGWLIQIEKKY
jgi:anti-sigma regulatory factor (Ser/Thr protein kinase)